MNFQPDTIIRFCRTGIDEQNKVVCHSQDDLFSAMTQGGKVMGVMQKCSFQRADNFFKVRVDLDAISYYSLMQCDTIFYLNDDQPGNFYVVGNITGVEWKNESCCWVYFKIDSFMTYQTMIDWGNTYAYIEREHIKEDWSSSGNPLFSNYGPSEDFGTQADTPFFIWSKSFTDNMEVVIQSPYDIGGEPKFDGTIKGNLYTSLQTLPTNYNGANEFFKKIAENPECSINNIVNVFGLPGEWSAAILNGGNAYGTDKTEEIPAINIAAKQLASMREYNNGKCWTAPFFNIRIMSSEGDTKDFTPQWLGNDQSNYTVRYRAAGAGGQFGGAQCTLMNKNGAFKWEGWNDFIVSLKKLPSCPWTGDGFTNWESVNGESTAVNKLAAIYGGISGVIQAIARGAISSSYASQGLNPNVTAGAGSIINSIMQAGDSAMGAVQEYAQIQAQIQQAKSSGAAVNGGGSFDSLLDIGVGNWGFKIVYYCTQHYALQSVDNYFDRFGYRINKLKKLEIENRPIWTFVKTIECHVVSNSGIPFIHQNAINAMFNAGVTMWKLDRYLGGQNIGDFSKAKDNKGVK